MRHEFQHAAPEPAGISPAAGSSAGTCRTQEPYAFPNSFIATAVPDWDQESQLAPREIVVDDEDGVPLLGDVVVFRCPCLRPQDIQLRRAVAGTRLNRGVKS